MKKNIIVTLVLGTVLTVSFTACERDIKATDDNRPAIVSKSFVEEFDDFNTLGARGWVFINNSEPVGSQGWRQGKYEVRFDSKNGQVVDGFPAYSSQKSQNDFVSADLNCGFDVSTLNAWLITPVVPIKNGDELSFYTRCRGDFPDRLQVRANLTTGTANVGALSSDVGDFTTTWLDINPGLTLSGYPTTWTKYTITVAGLPTNTTVSSRIAFRYFVPTGGPAGANSDMVGVDLVEFKSK